MAKLSPKDPQYGIPVSSRINGDLANRLNKEAQKAGKTFSRHLSEYISQASSNEKRIEELDSLIEEQVEIIKQLENEITKLHEAMRRDKIIKKNAISKLIIEISGATRRYHLN